MRYLLLLAAATLVAISAQQLPNCKELGTPCHASPTCDAAVNSFIELCKPVINDSAPCDLQCRAAWQKLVADDIGRQYNNCACPADDYSCKKLFANIKFLCLNIRIPQVLECRPSLPQDEPNELPTCNFLDNVCTRDAACQDSLLNYYFTCGGLFDGNGQCSQPCKSRLNHFTCNSLVPKIYNCKCAYRDTYCLRATYYTAQACYGLDKSPELFTSRQNCSAVAYACKSNTECNAKYSLFLTNCISLFTGGTTECSVDCKDAWDNLVSGPYGFYFRSCSCGNDTTCQVRWSLYYFYCTDAVWKVPQHCSQITNACQQDKTCSQDLDNFNNACADDFKGGRCGAACEAATKVLARDPIGARVAFCYCPANNNICTPKRKTIQDCLFPNPPEGEEGPTDAAGITFLSISTMLGMLAYQAI